MTATFKRGSTFTALLEFDVDEWAAIWPWDSASADAKQGSMIHDLTITPTPASRRVTLTASTATWALRPAQIDMRAVRNGQVIYLPPSANLVVNIIPPVTEAP